MSRVNDQFSVTFVNVLSTTDSTNECSTVTLYVTPAGVITHDTPPGVVNYDAQGTAITKEKLKNTPKNRNQRTPPRHWSYRLSAVVYTVVKLLINW